MGQPNPWTTLGHDAAAVASLSHLNPALACVCVCVCVCVQDSRLLSALLGVIEQPSSYFKYADSTEAMFPAAFIRLLRAKVVQFFQRNS